jgi:hypothetical protein
MPAVSRHFSSISSHILTNTNIYHYEVSGFSYLMFPVEEMEFQRWK